jgi:hypothetical protein
LILSYRYYCFLAESLLWFLGIVRLLTQPAMPRPTLVAVLLEINHGKESSRKRGPKRRAIYILGKQQEMQSFKTKDETG